VRLDRLKEIINNMLYGDSVYSNLYVCLSKLRLELTLIQYGKQSISRSDYRAIKSVLDSDWLTIGPKVEEFEHEIYKVCGSKNFVVSSGTAALHCAYAAIDLKPGDEVITPPITFISTQSTAMHFGAKIQFCDIDPKTGNMDPNLAESLINNKTKAITVVDFAGHPADLDIFRDICDRHNIFLIEDAAHSIGSLYKGRPVGSIADLTTFSFFPTKNFTTGEGGAVSSNNSKLLDLARKFGRQGLVREVDKFRYEPDGRWHQEVHKIGLNYRLPDILCSLGISQIKKIHNFKKSRTDIFNFYGENLREISEIQLPFKEDFVDPMWHLYPVRIKDGSRNKFYEFLWDFDIRVQVNYVPAYFHPVFQDDGYKKGICPSSEKFYQEEISLPIHPNLRPKDLNKIVKITKKFFGY
jgi:dTDP-4-amino-4,6-dideoxygalactose transaminase